MTAVLAEKRTGRPFVAALAAASLLPWVAAPLAGSVGPVKNSAVWWLAVLILGVAHVSTTMAFYFDREARPILDADRTRYFVWPVLAVAAGVVLSLAVRGDARLWLIGGFAVWQLHHFTRQNLGCLAFLCRARGVPGPTVAERRMLDLSSAAASFAVPWMAVRWDSPIAVASHRVGMVVLLSVTIEAWRAVRANPDPVRAAAVVFAAVFYLPLFIFPPGTLAVVGYGLAHGAQYLLMTGHLAAGRRTPWPMLFAVLVPLLTVGVGLELSSRHLTSAVPVLLGVQFGVVAAHFIIDAGVWKVRTPEQRVYMRRRFAFL